jgi:hypothetical protein
MINVNTKRAAAAVFAWLRGLYAAALHHGTAGWCYCGLEGAFVPCTQRRARLLGSGALGVGLLRTGDPADAGS